MRKSKKMTNTFNSEQKKGDNAIISIIAILFLITCSIISYNIWVTQYLNNEYIKTEKTNMNSLIVDDVITNSLYLINTQKNNITLLKVTLENKDCNISKKITSGMNEIDITACSEKIIEPVVEVVIYTNNKIYSKFVFIDKKRVPKENQALKTGEIKGGSDCSQLYKIGNNLSDNYFLSGDLNCIDTKNWNNGTGFEPIGNESLSFTGTFNGNGYTIYNLYINHSDKETGMFGSLDGATIKNLKFDLLSINGLKKSSGALSGFAQNSIIINISVKGDITGERKSVGGIIGELQNSIMSGCSYKNGTVTGDRKSVGGLVGYLDNSQVHNSFSTGNIVGIKDASGGLIGDQKDSIINNSYSTGNVVSSQGLEGGLIGNSLGSNIYDSYWDINTSGQTTSAGGIGKTTIEMQTTTTYLTWDTNIWQITNNQYPILK